MLVLGIETSCDETGVAVYDSDRGLLAHALHSQVALHDPYGGVVPELASRDHVRRLLPLARQVLRGAGVQESDLDAIAFTQGPGLAGALLVGAAVANGLAFGLGIAAIGVHHLEGHLLSPLLEKNAPALTAKLLGLSYPGGPALAKLAQRGKPDRFEFPRPMLEQLGKHGDLNFSFSGLKTAVVTLLRQRTLDEQTRADVAAAFQEAVVDVLVAKSLAAIRRTGLPRLVVAGGVGANLRLRALLDARAARDGFSVYYPAMEFCTDNGAMIALAGALRLDRGSRIENRGKAHGFTVRPRWDLATLEPGR